MEEQMEGQDEIDEQEQVDQLKKLEESILSVIAKIKKDRNRACFQNIHTFMNRRGINIEMEKLQKVIYNLILRNVIVDKGREGKQSFFLVDLTSEGKEIIDEVTCDSEHESSFNAIYELIDERFYSILINKIKSEVKLALSESQHNETIQNVKYINNKNEVNLKEDLITTLKEEITFLRNEMASKDKIIDLMIKDKFNERTENIVGKSSVTTGEQSVKSVINNLVVNKKDTVIDTNNNSSEVNFDDPAKSVSSDDDFTVVKPANARKKKRQISLIGDSLIKNIEQYKMQQCLKRNEKIYVKSFPGATTIDMADHARPSQRYSPDCFILHTGSNDLRSTKTPEQILDDIIKLATELKTDQNEVIVSAIVARKDEQNTKGLKVNDYLKIKCENYALGFISNTNILVTEHLNGSGLHLNYHGTKALANNFLNVINV